MVLWFQAYKISAVHISSFGALRCLRNLGLRAADDQGLPEEKYNNTDDA
jgi:hypothetical protein